MSRHTLKAEPLTREDFAPFGDVIEPHGAQHFPLNRGTVERFHDLASVDAGANGKTSIGIVECRQPAGVPLQVSLVERHSLGTQAFIPLGRATMCIVVAPAGGTVEPEDLRAFVSNGGQGINYHRGTWHMPLVAFEKGQRFLVVDRVGPGDDCEEHVFASDVEISVDAASIRAAGAAV